MIRESIIIMSHYSLAFSLMYKYPIEHMNKHFDLRVYFSLLFLHGTRAWLVLGQFEFFSGHCHCTVTMASLPSLACVCSCHFRSFLFFLGYPLVVLLHRHRISFPFVSICCFWYYFVVLFCEQALFTGGEKVCIFSIWLLCCIYLTARTYSGLSPHFRTVLFVVS